MPEQILAPGLLPEPEKPLSCAVTVHGNQVVQHFSAQREYVAFGGMEAVQIGAKLLGQAVLADPNVGEPVLQMCMLIMDIVYQARGDLKAPHAVKQELIERHRRTLTQRLGVVLNSTREKRKVSNAQLAKQLVDIMLKECFT